MQSSFGSKKNVKIANVVVGLQVLFAELSLSEMSCIQIASSEMFNLAKMRSGKWLGRKIAWR